MGGTEEALTENCPKQQPQSPMSRADVCKAEQCQLPAPAPEPCVHGAVQAPAETRAQQ